MGNSSKKGWIETFYGDYWAKEKKLIYAGVLIPLVFSFLLLVEIGLIWNLMNGEAIDVLTIFYNLLNFITLQNFIIFFITGVFICTLFRFYGLVLLRFWEVPLKETFKEIFEEKKPNPYMILVKCYVLNSINFIAKSLYGVIILLFTIILFTPSVLAGLISYSYVDILFIPNLVELTGLIPIIGEMLEINSVNVVHEVTIGVSNITKDIPVYYQCILLGIPLFLLLPLSNRIETTILRKQRGGIGKILKNGSKFILNNLNLPSKVAHFIFVNYMVLFTEQDRISLNIPVINDGNIGKAMHKIMCKDQLCFVTTLPGNGFDVVKKLSEFPDEITEEVRAQLVNIIKKSLVTRTLFEYMKTSLEQPNLEKRDKFAERYSNLNKNVLFYMAMNENGVRAYAIVRVPSPEYMTRKIERLWCNNPMIKDRIIEEIQKMDNA